MSRIVIDARELRTSSGRYIERTLHYLMRTKSEHEYLVLLQPKDIDGWQITNNQFQAVACPHKEFTFAEQTDLLRQITSLKPDLVHFAFPQQPIFYHGNTITTFHDLTTIRFDNPDKNPAVFKAKQQVYKQVVRRAAHKSTRVIAISEFTKRDLIDFTHIHQDKVSVIYEAADPIMESPAALPDLQNKKFIMYVGRPTPHKNLEQLINAFHALRAQHPHLLLALAGKKDSNYRRIEESVHERGIENVVFTDFISEGQLRWMYEHCAAYALPSLAEGFSLTGLEAMQHGAPVVSSDATCLPEIYGDAAHYFNPYDSRAIADALNEVLTDKELRSQLIERGHTQVKQYSWQRCAEQTLDVYNQALGRV